MLQTLSVDLLHRSVLSGNTITDLAFDEFTQMSLEIPFFDRAFPHDRICNFLSLRLIFRFLLVLLSFNLHFLNVGLLMTRVNND